MDQFNYSNYDGMSLQGFIAKSFKWMFFGLLIFFVTGFAVSTIEPLTILFYGNPILMIILAFAEIFLVIRLSAGLMKMSVSAARNSFIGYSLISGIFFSSVFIVFDINTVMYTFLITGVLFGIMAIAGSRTSVDLSKLSTLFLFGLLGLIIVSVVNIFLGSSQLEFGISIIAILLFLGITAWDVQRMKRMYYAFASDGELTNKVAIYGALQLFLDFVNIFYYLLRIVANSRD